MKRRLSFSMVLFWLVLRSSGLRCSPEEYPLEDVKCCRKCSPGTEMQRRCTKFTDTVCQPCEEGSFKALFSTWRCTPCTICSPANGLQEVKKCEGASDAVCVCLPGHEPTSAEHDRKRCDPCPKGHFSRGGEKACTPWTNCTARGTNTFRVGTKEEDAVCENPPPAPHATKLPTKPSPKREMVHASSVGKPSSKPSTTPSTPTALTTEDLPGGVKKSGYLLYILVAAALLLVSGGVILLKFFRKTKKYKEPGNFVVQTLKEGKTSFRIPVQEEQIDAKSSLVQN
ncbi:tumor necrosis factor receptor superfamily member 4 [Paroedura picta]|uniref:tumor necrosis factor receptor superfamily member 4 n=1 Tax=Paroedura picta TaxID=143630 RepID=UPI00405675AB